MPKPQQNKHIGSSLDSFLEEEGILDLATDEALKSVAAWLEMQKEVIVLHRDIGTRFAKAITVVKALQAKGIGLKAAHRIVTDVMRDGTGAIRLPATKNSDGLKDAIAGTGFHLTTFERSSGNVFYDLNIPNPEAHMRKAEVVALIQKRIEARKLTAGAAAKVLSIKPSVLTKMLQGRFEATKLDRLQRYLADLDVIEKPQKKKAR